MRNPLKNIEPKRIIKESMERDRKLETAEHKPKIKDEKTELQASLAEKSLPGTVPSYSSTPGGATISEPCVTECGMNPEATPVEGLNVINGPKCNKVLNVITFCPKCNKVVNVITICPKCNKLLSCQLH